MALIFNGKSSDDYGIHIEKTPEYPVPEKDYEITHVPGRSGDVLIDNGSYKNVELNYEVSLGDPSSTFTQLKNAIINWIYPSSGYCTLIDEDDSPGLGAHYYRMAVYKDSFDISPVLSHGARATLIFNAKPQRYLSVGDVEVTAYNGSSSAIENPTGFESYPIISVTGSGTIKVYHSTQGDMSNKKLYCELEISGDEAGVNGYVEYGQEIKNGPNGSFGESDIIQKVMYDSTNNKLIIIGNFPGKAAVYSVSDSSVTFLQNLTYGGNTIAGEIYCAELVPQTAGNNIIIAGKFSSALALCWKFNSSTGKYEYLSPIAYMATKIYGIVPMDNTRILMFAANSYAYPAIFNGTTWSIDTGKGINIGGIPTIAKNYKSLYALVCGDFKDVLSPYQARCYAKTLRLNSSTNQVLCEIEQDEITSKVVAMDVTMFSGYVIVALSMSNGVDFKLFHGTPTEYLEPITSVLPPQIDGPVNFIKIGDTHSSSGTYGDFSFKMIVSGDITKKVAYFRIGFNPTDWAASFTFRDYIPAYSNGQAFLSSATGFVFTEDGEATSQYSYGVLVSNDSIKASAYVFPPESTIVVSGITIVSELADAYKIQNGQIVNKNYSVYFVDGIVPKMDKFTTFEPTSDSNITLIKVKPKWWML